MEEKIEILNSKGNKLSAILCNPTSNLGLPIYILCHGHGSYKNSRTNLELKEKLSKENVSTLRIDFFGHGESDGEFEKANIGEAINDVECTIKFLRGRGYKKIGLVGSSYGGFACLIVASKNPEIYKLILKSPALDYTNWRRLLEASNFGQNWKNKGYTFYKTSDGKNMKLSYSFIDYFANDGSKYDAFRLAENVECPTLIVHGDKDEDAPYKLSKKVSKIISKCELKTIEGADHQYSDPVLFQRMIETIISFILKNRF